MMYDTDEDSFICPITQVCPTQTHHASSSFDRNVASALTSHQEIMREPVILIGDGHSYEKAAIEAWFEGGNNTSPVTGGKLYDMERQLIPNFALKSEIEDSQQACGTSSTAVSDVPDMKGRQGSVSLGTLLCELNVYPLGYCLPTISLRFRRLFAVELENRFLESASSVLTPPTAPLRLFSEAELAELALPTTAALSPEDIFFRRRESLLQPPGTLPLVFVVS
eukprot:1195611-Prorocentrum_minimum.AAC.2